MRHVTASNFWLHSLTTLVPTFLCPCFAHIGSQSTFTPPPTLCNIPFTCTHWMQKPSKACAWADTKFFHKICFITNAIQQTALNQILITTHICKIVKATISFNMSVHQSICTSTWNNSAPNLPISWNLFLRIFRKTVEKIQFALKYHNNRYFTWTTTYYSDHISHVFLEWKTFQTKVL